MSSIVAVTSIHSIGASFLEWSINYLSGGNKYFNTNFGIMDLVDDPLSGSNAHKHVKNHPMGLHETKDTLDKFKEFSGLKTLYPYPLQIDPATKQLGISVFNISKENNELVQNLIRQDFDNTLALLTEHNAKIIILDLNPNMALYNTDYRTLCYLFHDHTKMATSYDEIRESFDLVFFENKSEQWGDSESMTKWDIREKHALDYRPFDLPQLEFDKTIPHYWLDAQMLWLGGEEEITKIMSFCDIEIDSSRLDSWRQVFSRWQKIQYKHAKFCFEFEHIMDCVLRGHSYQIDLTFNQEVVIQHTLIYRHNLNLKTWQLEKFPNDTKELHLLLEPNFHELKYKI